MSTVVSMSRTTIEIDDDLVRGVMRRHGLRTKREAVDYALPRLTVVPMTTEEIVAMRGVGWEGDLEAMSDGEARERAER